MMDGGGRSFSCSEDSRDTSVDSPQGSGNHSENDTSDISNSDPGLLSLSVPPDIKNESVIGEVEAKAENEQGTSSAPASGFSAIWDKGADHALEEGTLRPMISVKKSEDLFDLMNGSKDVVNIKQECKSPSIEQESSSPAEEELADQPQHPAVPSSLGLQPSDRAPTIHLHRSFGSGVVMCPLSQPQRVPQLPPCIQLSKRPMPQGSEGPEAKERKLEAGHPSKVKLPDAITLVTRTPKKNNLTDLLANRGTTVVPAPRSHNLPGQLNSAVSITRSPLHQRVKVEAKLVSLPTVDLTKESDTPRRFLNRAVRSRKRNVCQICDKTFPTSGELYQHMMCHRVPVSRHECRECRAQYGTEAALEAHRKKYHGAGGPSPDMALPVVDLKQPGVLAKLTQLGIRSVIPLSQLHSGSGGGMFGLPVVALDSASNPAICNIGDLGASNLLPMGPLKNLSFNNNMR